MDCIYVPCPVDAFLANFSQTGRLVDSFVPSMGLLSLPIYVCRSCGNQPRLVAKYGMIAVKSASMDLTGIEGVRNDVSILGRILGYGTLMACGKGGKNIGIADLAAPEKFQNALYEAMESSK